MCKIVFNKAVYTKGICASVSVNLEALSEPQVGGWMTQALLIKMPTVALVSRYGPIMNTFKISGLLKSNEMQNYEPVMVQASVW